MASPTSYPGQTNIHCQMDEYIEPGHLDEFDMLASSLPLLLSWHPLLLHGQPSPDSQFPVELMIIQMRL